MDKTEEKTKLAFEVAVLLSSDVLLFSDVEKSIALSKMIFPSGQKDISQKNDFLQEETFLKENKNLNFPSYLKFLKFCANTSFSEKYRDASITIYVYPVCNKQLVSGIGIVAYADNKEIINVYGRYTILEDYGYISLVSLKYALALASLFISSHEHVSIESPSKYAVNAVSHWSFAWEKNSWRKSNGSIKNLKLIQEAFSLYKKTKHVFSIHSYSMKDFSDDDIEMVKIKKANSLAEKAVDEKINDILLSFNK